MGLGLIAAAGFGSGLGHAADEVGKEWTKERVAKELLAEKAQFDEHLATVQSGLRTNERAVEPYTLSEGSGRYGAGGELIASSPKTATPETPEKVKESEARTRLYGSQADLNEGAKKRLLESQSDKNDRGGTSVSPQETRDARQMWLRALSVSDTGEKVQPDSGRLVRGNALIDDLMKNGTPRAEAVDLVMQAPIVSRQKALEMATAEAAKTPKVGWTGSGPRNDLDVGGRSMPRDKFIQERSTQIMADGDKALQTWREQVGLPGASATASAAPSGDAAMPDQIVDDKTGQVARRGTGGEYFTMVDGQPRRVIIKSDTGAPQAAATTSPRAAPAQPAAQPVSSPAAAPAPPAVAQVDPVEQAGQQVEQVRAQLSTAKQSLRSYGIIQRHRDPAAFEAARQQVAELEAAERAALSKYQTALGGTDRAAFTVRR